MATIMPDGELLRRALIHLHMNIQDHPEKSLDILLDQTAMNFNLSPRDAAQLERLFLQESQKNINRSQ